MRRWWSDNWGYVLIFGAIILFFGGMVGLVIDTSVKESERADQQDAFRSACVLEGGMPAFDTDIGDICIDIHELIEVKESQ